MWKFLFVLWILTGIKNLYSKNKIIGKDDYFLCWISLIMAILEIIISNLKQYD